MVSLGLVLGVSARSDPTPASQAEVAWLLTFVEQSGCAFNRNGTWYDSKRAREHLRTKYEALLARHQVETADDFITRGASASSFSGKAYQVRCGTDPVQGSREWLRDALRKFRDRSAPPALRGAPEQINRPS